MCHNLRVLISKQLLLKQSVCLFLCFGCAKAPQWDLLIHDFSRSHSDTPQSVGLLWTSDQPVAETYLTRHNTHNRHPCPPVGFEPTISAAQRPQAYALDRAATGTSKVKQLSQNSTLYPHSVFICIYVYNALKTNSHYLPPQH